MNHFLLVAISILCAGLRAAPPAPTKGVSRPPDATAGKEPSYKAIDVDVSALDNGLSELETCVVNYELLNASAMRAEKKAKEAAEPSPLAGLAPMKRKLASKSMASCIAEAGVLSKGFDTLIAQLKTFEPASAKGVLARRNAATAKRAQVNQFIARLGGKANPVKPSVGGSKPAGVAKPADDAPQ